MTGVVLCGGKSTRMGSDKGMHLYKSVTWAQQAAIKLSFLAAPVVLSVNVDQRQAYQSAFTTFSVISDNAILAIGGPLRGILSVHLQFPLDDLLVLACDMVCVPEEVLAYLYNQYKQSNAEAMVFINKDQPEPLAGIYKAEGLKKIFSLYRKHELKMHSMRYVLENLKTIYLPLPEEWKKYFINFNMPADLNSLPS